MPIDRHGWILSGLLLFTSSSFATPAPAQAIEKIYKSYAGSGNPVSFSDTGENRITSSRMASVIDMDARLTPPGDVGALDYDPVCACQDYENLVVEEIAINQPDAAHATAQVRIRQFAESENVTTLTLALVQENQRWLIDDIIDSEGSLYQRLNESNQTALAHSQPPQRQTIHSTAQNPRDFIEYTYEHIDTVDFARILSPELQKTLQENNALIPEDEISYFNFNPLCGCQDGKVTFQKMKITGPDSLYDLRVRVFFSLAEYGERTVDLKLIPSGKMWKIDDVISPETGSLKKALQENSARLMKEDIHQPDTPRP